MGRRAVPYFKREEGKDLLIKYNNSIRKVSRIAKVSTHFVENVKEKASRGLPLKNRPGQGRKRKTTTTDDHHLVLHSKLHRHDVSRQLLSLWKGATNKNVDVSTVRRRLLKHGMRGYVAQRKPFLTQRNRKKRLQWCRQHKAWTVEQWKQVIFCDESHFTVMNRGNRVYVRRQRNESDAPFNFQPRIQGGGGEVSVWGCITFKGVGMLVVYQGRLNANSYQEVAFRGLAPSIGAAFNPLLDQFMVLQDGATCHTGKGNRQWFESHGVNLLSMPPSSPDLNIIENLWSEIDQKLIDCNYMTKKNFTEVLTNLWYQTSIKYVNALYESMPRRIEAVIKANGFSSNKY